MKKKMLVRWALAASLLAAGAEGVVHAAPSFESLVPPWLWTVAWKPPHPPLPQIVNGGGPTIAQPRIVPILYASDPNLAALEDYFAKLGTSRYFTDATAEYGVTSLTVAPPIVLTDPPPTTALDTDVATWIDGKLSDPSFPPNDGRSVYAFMYPAGTTLQMTGWNGNSFTYPLCGSAHAEGVASADGSLIAFTMTGFCTSASVDELTGRTTMSLLGAVTNPSLSGYPAWGGTNFAGSGWATYTGNEIGLFCPASEGAVRPADLGYLVPRVYSNKAAAADRNPCIPAPAGEGYFNAAPVADGLDEALVKGVSVPPGGEAVVPLALFGEGAPRSWTLSAVEIAGFEPTPSLSFEFDDTRGRAGEVRYLKIKRAATTQAAPPIVGVSIVSTAGAAKHEWILAVGP